MRAAIYLRISSDSQIDNTSIETQESICRTYCVNECHDVIDIVKDEAISAKKTNNQRVLELLEYCQNNKNNIDLLLVFKLDRFARSQEQHHWLRNKLLKLNIVLRSATERIGESGSEKLIEGVLAAVNEYDNDIRIERARLGMLRRLEEGLWPWLPPYGYYYPQKAISKVGIAQVDQNCAETIRDIFSMHSSGMYSYKSIASDINSRKATKWNGKPLTLVKQTIETLLNNPFYIGFTYSTLDKTIRQGKHEPLITMDLWEKCQHVKKYGSAHNKIRNKENSYFPLRQFI